MSLKKEIKKTSIILKVLSLLLDANHFPDITICAFPPFDQENLNKLGYSTSFGYTRGTPASGDSENAAKTM